MTDEMNKNLENEEIELDALDDVSGGAYMRDPGVFWEVRVTFTEDDVKKLKEMGWSANIAPNREYTRGEVNDLLGFGARNKRQLADILRRLGIPVSGDI